MKDYNICKSWSNKGKNLNPMNKYINEQKSYFWREERGISITNIVILFNNGKLLFSNQNVMELVSHLEETWQFLYHTINPHMNNKPKFKPKSAS